MYLGQEILWTQTLLKILWLEIFRPCNKSDPWFRLKSLVIPDPILLSPEPFPLIPDSSHLFGFEPWAHIPYYYDPVICPICQWILYLFIGKYLVSVVLHENKLFAKFSWKYEIKQNMTQVIALERKAKNDPGLKVIYQTWDAVFHH